MITYSSINDNAWSQYLVRNSMRLFTVSPYSPASIQASAVDSTQGTIQVPYKKGCWNSSLFCWTQLSSCSPSALIEHLQIGHSRGGFQVIKTNQQVKFTYIYSRVGFLVIKTNSQVKFIILKPFTHFHQRVLKSRNMWFPPSLCTQIIWTLTMYQGSD